MVTSCISVFIILLIGIWISYDLITCGYNLPNNPNEIMKKSSRLFFNFELFEQLFKYLMIPTNSRYNILKLVMNIQHTVRHSSPYVIVTFIAVLFHGISTFSNSFIIEVSNCIIIYVLISY